MTTPTARWDDSLFTWDDPVATWDGLPGIAVPPGVVGLIPSGMIEVTLEASDILVEVL